MVTTKVALRLPLFSKQRTRRANGEVLRCIAFSPYVQGYNPNTGPHPSRALIRQLLDKLKQQTSFRCIQTYGVLNGMDYIFKAANARGLKVIAILYLGPDQSINDQSITRGIAAAKKYSDTIIRISCGSEVRTRQVADAEGKIRTCLERLRAAGVTQPLTTIEVWWEWCNRAVPCQMWDMVNDVDWIGINVFPWWENKYSGIYPCTTAAQAADFHIARMQDVMNTYPNKEVILTEFGWPGGPHGYRETNLHTGQQCGVAKERNQNRVIKQTLAKLDQKGWSATVFSAFREPWKTNEGPVGPYWGICQPAPPYDCKPLY